MTAPFALRTVLKPYPHTEAVRRGELTRPEVVLDVQEVNPVHKAFAPMVREEAYDLCELAVVTALQAVVYERPVVLLPVVVASRFQRGCIIARRVDGVPSPDELVGKRIGVRSYTQTTGMWVRAHLAADAGVRVEDVSWITQDPPHVEQYRDPAWVTRVGKNRSLEDMLRDGEIDAAILGNDLPQSEEFIPVFTDAAARDRAWWERHGFMPVNHMVVAGQSAATDHPQAVRAAFELLREADSRVTRDAGAPSPTMFGFERLREPLDIIIDTCMTQGLLPRRPSVDEVFAPARHILGRSGD
ncbi:MAG: hypothetical protein ABW193_13785 [Luteibacter sp.]